MASEKQPDLAEGRVEKPFHARIFQNYLSLLRSEYKWNEADIESFLNSIGTSLARIQDDSTWYELEFTDRFYSALVERLGDPQLALKAGFNFSNEVRNSPLQFVLKGLMSPSGIYPLVPKFTSHFNRVLKLSVEKCSRNYAKIVAEAQKGSPDRKYMCENRWGMFASVPEIFGSERAKIEHSTCMHQGSDQCVYEIRWESESFNLSMLWPALVVVLSMVLPFVFLESAAAFMTAGFLSLTALSIFLWLNSRSWKEEASNQSAALHDSLHKLDHRHHELNLIHEVTSSMHRMDSAEQLSELVVRNVCENLDYDRALLLMVNPGNNSLDVKAHYGFDQELRETISDVRFNNRPDESSGFFVRVLNENEPLLIPNVASHMHELSPRSQSIAKILKTKSLVAVPLTNSKQEAIGVLAVDNVIEGKKLSISDQDLLMTFSQQIGTAIDSAHLMTDLREALERSEQAIRAERRLKKTFSLFVPEQSSEMIGNNPDIDLRQNARITNVTILFCDIVGFTKISDELASQDVISLLNLYFEYAVPVISQQKGIIDKFTGDGFLAIFDGPESAHNACFAARSLIQLLPKINEALESEGYPAIELGIGLHYGRATLGHVGTKDRVNYTVIGKTVNVAARLESHTRQLGSNRICASATVRTRGGSQFDWIELGPVQVRGLKDPVHSFELQVSPRKTLESASEANSRSKSGQ